MQVLKKYIREVPNWPKEGVNFKDITTLLENKEAFKIAIDAMTNPLKNKKIDKMVGIDARGFIVASPIAYNIGAGLTIVRKKGKLPSATIEKEYTLEYNTEVIQMNEDAIKKGEVVVLADDLCATGGTALAACELIEQLGGKIKEVTFLIDLPFLGGSKKLEAKGYIVNSLLSYDKE